MTAADGRSPDPTSASSAEPGEIAVAEPPDRLRVFPCGSCGADLKFDPGVQSLRCPFCGSAEALDADPGAIVEQDYEAMIRRLAELRERGREDVVELREVDCAACGATTRFIGTLTADTCAYCGAPVQPSDAHAAAHRVPVDGVLPFRVEHATARDRLRTWVRSLWFAPSEFTRRGVEGRFQGVYLPYWTFDAQTHNAYVGMRGDHHWVTRGSGKNKRRVRQTRWSPASGRFRKLFDDVQVIATTGLPPARLAALEPWPLAECRPFSPELLAGFQSRTYDIDLASGFQGARAAIDGDLRGEVRARIGGDEQQIHELKTAYEGVTFKHLLLPVWILGYRWKDTTFQVLVNAVTGEVQGDRPYSWVKIALAVLGVAAALGAVLLVRALAG
jgi:DNA-directed RNA polymerase subunit RPC12/RpoP